MKLSQSIAILLLPLKAMACGLDWSEPVSHFENVDFQGNVHIVRKLGEIEKLPIYLIFNSSYGMSPYAGSGFEIPLLESRMWQVDENRFQMKAPSGWLWIFQRTKMPSVLEGNAGWKGLIKDDTITVWAPCGDKISFKNGKIVSMQLKNDKYDYAYKGNRVESIQKNGRAILEVKSDDKTGDITGINLPITRELIGLQQTGSRPMVETLGGTTVVSRMVKSLATYTKSDGSGETFEFGVDEKMNPTLKLNERTIVWNSTTKKVKKEGEWTYQIKPSSNYAPLFSASEIKRISTGGTSELWAFDPQKGIEESLSNKVLISYKWFTSGILDKKVKEVNVKDSNGVASTSFIYSENGNLLRKVTRITDKAGTKMECLQYLRKSFDGKDFVLAINNKRNPQSLTIRKDNKLVCAYDFASKTAICFSDSFIKNFGSDEARDTHFINEAKIILAEARSTTGNQ
jgi:hypothetical protein